MIISASRRTDIPAFYSDWFFNRIKDGYVMVRNPMNHHQVSKIALSPDVVDCIVFWTKNPLPMLDRIDELKDYNYYFQFTLNSYAQDIEPSVPSKSKEVIGTFKKLSDKIGAERIVWRYDPIIINDKYPRQYHIDYFEKLAHSLEGKFNRCVISFVDYYKKNATNFRVNNISEPFTNDVLYIAERFSEIAQKNGFKIYSCAEKYDLENYGIQHGKCIDDGLIEQIIGSKLSVQKDKNQRAECGCVDSIDIGSYNTCLHGCKYCYANYSMNSVCNNSQRYDPHSPILCSSVSDDDKVTERKVTSLIDKQLDMF